MLSGEKFNAFSAGSKPKGQIHPKSIATLNYNNLNTLGYRSKSWDDFTKPDAPVINIVITVCSNAANESCPVFPGNPVSAHWNINDPARDFETNEGQDKEFLNVYMELEQRINHLVTLPTENMDKLE